MRKGRASGNDFHEPCALVVPFSLISLEKGKDVVIITGRKFLPLVVLIDASMPAPEVHALRRAGRFDIGNDAARVAHALCIAQFPGAGSLHHARVGIACVEDRIIGIRHGEDRVLRAGEETGLLIAGRRDDEGEGSAQDDSGNECADFRIALALVSKHRRRRQCISAQKDDGKRRRFEAEVEGEKNGGQG